MARNKDFSSLQEKEIKNYINISKTLIKKNKISPGYLLYIISELDDKSLLASELTKIFLRDSLPQKRRLFIDYNLRSLK